MNLTELQMFLYIASVHRTWLIVGCLNHWVPTVLTIIFLKFLASINSRRCCFGLFFSHCNPFLSIKIICKRNGIVTWWWNYDIFPTIATVIRLGYFYTKLLAYGTYYKYTHTLTNFHQQSFPRGVAVPVRRDAMPRQKFDFTNSSVKIDRASKLIIHWHSSSSLHSLNLNFTSTRQKFIALDVNVGLTVFFKN